MILWKQVLESQLTRTHIIICRFFYSPSYNICACTTQLNSTQLNSTQLNLNYPILNSILNPILNWIVCSVYCFNSKQLYNFRAEKTERPKDQKWTQTKSESEIYGHNCFKCLPKFTELCHQMSKIWSCINVWVALSPISSWK